MEVILSRDVDRIGKAGQVVRVKDGFARNFLLPNNLALPVTPANVKKLEEEKRRKSLELEKTRKEAEAVKARLEALSLTMPVLVQEEDKMYASITAQDISGALKDEGIEIDKNLIVMDSPIKALGIYEVSVKLHPEISTKIKVWIVKK
jgi:large subunit ribosomal protein L9